MAPASPSCLLTLRTSVALGPTLSFANFMTAGSSLSGLSRKFKDFAVNACLPSTGFGSSRVVGTIIGPIFVGRRLASTVDRKRHNTAAGYLGSNCWPVSRVRQSIRRGKCRWAGIGAATRARCCLAQSFTGYTTCLGTCLRGLYH